MGICPRCGSWVDEGEPYCPECCYMGEGEENTITIDGRDYDARVVESVLRDFCYTLEDLEYGRVDDEDMEEILEELW